MIAATMAPLTMLSHSVLVQSPMVSLSFSSRIRNTSAAGSSVTATTWTNSVISTSGAPGISTTRPAVTRVKK